MELPQLEFEPSKLSAKTNLSYAISKPSLVFHYTDDMLTNTVISHVPVQT